MGSIWQTYALVLVAFGIGFFKAGVGVGTGLFTSSLLSLFLEPQIAIPLSAPLMLFSDIITIRLYRGYAQSGLVAKIVLPALLGTVCGSNLLLRMTSYQARFLIGFLAIAFVLNRLSHPAPPEITLLTRPATLFSVGFLAGIFSGFAHSGGTIVSMYLMLLNFKKEEFIATMAQLLLFLNLMKLGVYLWLGLLPGRFLITGVLLVPFLIAGGLLARRMNRYLSNQRFNHTILAIIWVSGIVLLIG